MTYKYMVTCRPNCFIVSWHLRHGNIDNTQGSSGTMVVHNVDPLQFSNAIRQMWQNCEDPETHRQTDIIELGSIRMVRKGNLLSITQDNIRVLYHAVIGALAFAMHKLESEWRKYCKKEGLEITELSIDNETT